VKATRAEFRKTWLFCRCKCSHNDSPNQLFF